jgi:putative FmdB family regulatory protein
MPTYEYACRACGHTFEIVQSMRDETLTVCPECGGELRKVFAPPAISFKGSGFYATDHGKKAKAAASDTQGAGTSDKQEKQEKEEKKERKAETKTEGTSTKENAAGSSSSSSSSSKGTKGKEGSS